MKTLAETLINTKKDTCCADLMAIVGAENGQEYSDKINTIYDSLTDIETVQKMAVRFNGCREFLNYEDRLCELMGDDEYFEWSDSVGVK